jgi:hypothetical protein
MPAKPKDTDTTAGVNDISSRRNLQGVIITAFLTGVTAIAVAVINNCGNGQRSSQHFTGRVSDKNTEARIARAKVSLETEGVPAILYTDSEGNFNFPIKDPDKQLHIRIEAEKYQNYDLRIVPSKNQGNQDIRLTLKTEETVELPAIVLDSNDRAIQGAAATLDDLVPPPAPVTSSTDGTFTIRNIPRKCGEMVRLRVTAEGYEPNPHVEDIVLCNTPPRIKLARRR